MKYIIFFPILLIYVILLSLVAGIQCLWSFDFNQFRRRKRNLNHNLRIGHWLFDAMGIK